MGTPARCTFPSCASRSRRDEMEWTQAELARRCDLHKGYIGFMERGERNISLISLRRIAKVVRVPLSDLLKGLN